MHQFLPRFQSGTELYVLRLARALMDRGHRVSVFTGDPCLHEFPVLRESSGRPWGVRTHYVAATPPVLANRIEAEYDHGPIARRFARFLDRERPDVVHVCHLAHLGAGLIDAAAARGIPTVVQLFDFWALCPRTTMLRHDGTHCARPEPLDACVDCMGRIARSGYGLLVGRTPPPNGVNRPWDLGEESLRAYRPLLQRAARERPRVLREALARADLVIAPSRFLHSVFLANGHSGIEILPYAVADELAPGPPRTPGPALRFGFVGSILRHKGPDVLLEAFGQLAWPEASLVLHGDPDVDPDFGERIRALAASDARVRLAGPFEHDRLQAVLADLDVLVVPSHWYENTPFVALEARAAGLPVVAADVPGLLEAVDAGRGALVFRRGDPADLAARLRELRDDPGRVEALRGELEPVPRMTEHTEALLEIYARLSRGSARGEAPTSTAMEERATRAARIDLQAWALQHTAAALEAHLRHSDAAIERMRARLQAFELRNRKLERSFAQRLILALSKLRSFRRNGSAVSASSRAEKRR